MDFAGPLHFFLPLCLQRMQIQTTFFLPPSPSLIYKKAYKTLGLLICCLFYLAMLLTVQIRLLATSIFGSIKPYLQKDFLPRKLKFFSLKFWQPNEQPSFEAAEKGTALSVWRVISTEPQKTHKTPDAPLFFCPQEALDCGNTHLVVGAHGFTGGGILS